MRPKHDPPRAALTRRGFLGATGAVAAGGGAVAAAACSGPSASGASSDRLNVLLLIVDSVRPDFVGAYGAPRIRTPNIDALCNRGTKFTRFFPEAFPTVPARRTIYTGRRIFPFRGWRRYPDLGRGPGSAPITELDTLFTRELARKGYWTAQASDNPFTAFTRSWRPFRLTWDRFVSVVGHSGTRRDPESVTREQLLRWLPDGLRDDDRYLDGMARFLANNGYGTDDAELSAARVFKEGTKLLEEAAEKQPFALVVDCFDPHEPWCPTPEYVAMYADPDYNGPNPGTARYTRAENYLELDEVRQMRAVYSASLTITDKWLGTFLERFEELGLHENTAIVLMSDHGLLLGDRGWTGKIAQELHPELIQAPLAVIHPGGRGAGQTSSFFASTHDIAPTLLSLAGVAAPRAMHGVDLSPLLDGEQPAERPYAYGGYFNHFFVRSDHWSFVADNNGGQRELYDLALDPAEVENVAVANRDVHNELYDWLLDEVGGELPYYTGEIVAPGRR